MTMAITPREEEVLALVAQGWSNKGIAASLFISENTVRAHVRILMVKTNSENRTQLAIWAIKRAHADGLVNWALDAAGVTP